MEESRIVEALPVGILEEDRLFRGDIGGVRAGKGMYRLRSGLSRQMPARCDLPEPTGPQMMTTGDGQAGQ